jgi:hypothetical protein
MKELDARLSSWYKINLDVSMFWGWVEVRVDLRFCDK